ncbi:tRNA-dihydrouridine synthase [Gigaspora margarita]|uniref:tRNA-dihydrouridine synthase n=1 Tax=Gigaspora margarita TaxID=4874 RepID=A0A8H3X731_GIGMA|nr:tRNA-dihydrouridine synthase [Gigaspora margarita]
MYARQWLDIVNCRFENWFVGELSHANILVSALSTNFICRIHLFSSYNVDLAYTPMILAKEFKNSSVARDFDFSTSPTDSPLIIQFASNSPVELAKAAELVIGYVDGIDLNCGCPQKWALNEGIGANLMDKPELVKDMIRTIKGSGVNLPFSIKIRIHNDMRKTLSFTKNAESVGVDFIAIHGRTRRQKSTSPIDLDTIRLCKESLQIPVIANGNVFSLEDANILCENTKVDGVMTARGILKNPALFAGYESTPWECVDRFIKLSLGLGTTHYIFHHHLMYMFEDFMSNAERKTFNTLTSIPAIVDYLGEHYGLQVD